MEDAQDMKLLFLLYTLLALTYNDQVLRFEVSEVVYTNLRVYTAS